MKPEFIAFLEKYYFAIFAFLTGSGIFAFNQPVIKQIKYGFIIVFVSLCIGLITIYLNFVISNISSWLLKSLVSISLLLSIVGTGLILSSFFIEKNCDSFNSKSDAQIYFLNKQGSIINNVDDLDRDHNGIACN